MRGHTTPAGLLAIGLTLAACSRPAETDTDRLPAPSPSTASATSPITSPSPNPSSEVIAGPEMTDAELAAWAEEAVAFVDRFHANYRNAETTFADLADDANLFDPSNGDYSVNDKADLVSSWQGFADAFPDLERRTLDVFVSPATVAARVDVLGLWPSEPIPPDARSPEIRLFRFEDGNATSFELSYRVDWLEALAATRGDTEGCGACFVPEVDCGSDLRNMVDRYLEAWGSGDEEAIAGTTLSANPSTCTRRRSETRGTAGSSGSRFHYRCHPGPGDPWSVEGLTILDLGTRLPNSFEPDQDGLIVREEVLHDAESLIRAGS